MSVIKCAAVFFDMDGVLIQSKQLIETNWINVAISRGINITQTDIVEKIHGRPGEFTLNELFKEFSEQDKVLIKAEVDKYEENAVTPLTKGVITMLEKIKDENIPIALVTSSWSKRIKFVLDDHKLEKYFDLIVSRHDVVSGKPSPECYLLAAKQFNVDPKYSLIFEDSFSGVIAAVKSGSKCIGIAEKNEQESLLKLGASSCYPNFDFFREKHTVRKLDC